MSLSTTFRRKPALLAGIAALALAPAAFAADQTTTIATGEVRTTPTTVDSPLAGDTHTVENSGLLRGTSLTLSNSLVLTGTGAGRVVINNNGRIQGRLNFATLTGGVTLNNYTSGTTGGWAFSVNALNPLVFSAGNDVVNNTATGQVTTAAVLFVDFGAGTDAISNAGTWTSSSFTVTGLEAIANTGAMTFGVLTAADLETLTNSGTFRAGGMVTPNLETITNSGAFTIGAAFGATATLAGLETFNNSGLIVLGGASASVSNGSSNDRLIAQGAEFAATGASRIALDANLGALSQATCPVEETVLADCLNLAGGSVSGVTLLTVTGVATTEGGAFNPVGMTLIDVSGGTTGAADFVLDPNSPGYSADTLFGGGIVAANGTPYSLFYDAATQTHRLVGLPQGSVLELGILASAAQDLWRIGDEAGYARQAELRAGSGGGLWAKVTGGTAEREATATLTAYGLSDTAPTRYEQKGGAAVFGADITGDNGAYILGVSAGHIQSRIEVGAAASRYELTGLAVSLYGGYSLGALRVDASASGYAGSMKAPASVAVQEVDGDVSAFGGRVEAAWRFPLGGGLTVEPLAGAVYVQSSLSDIALPGDKLNAVNFGKGKSLRGGLGARAAFEADLGGMAVDLSLTGRGWKEFQGDNPAAILGRGGGMELSDEFSGDFGEIAAAAAISSADGLIAGFASVGGRFGEDADSASATLGLRFNW